MQYRVERTKQPYRIAQYAARARMPHGVKLEADVKGVQCVEEPIHALSRKSPFMDFLFLLFTGWRWQKPKSACRLKMCNITDVKIHGAPVGDGTYVNALSFVQLVGEAEMIRRVKERGIAPGTPFTVRAKFHGNGQLRVVFQDVVAPVGATT